MIVKFALVHHVANLTQMHKGEELTMRVSDTLGAADLISELSFTMTLFKFVPAYSH